MRNRQRKTAHPKRPKQSRAAGAQVRPTKAREERDSRASRRKHRDESPVGRPELQVVVAGKGVVDERDGGGPHEDEDALEVELHVEQVHGLAVRHERVEGRGQGEAQRHAQEVGAADGDVRARGGVVPGWDLCDDQLCDDQRCEAEED